MEMKNIVLKAAGRMVEMAAVVILVLGANRIGKIQGSAAESGNAGMLEKAIAVSDFGKSEPAINVDIYFTELQEVGELTTGIMDYKGIVELTKGNLPVLTRHSFLMEYEANVRAGVDFSEIVVREEDGQWVVSVPHSEILSVSIDPDSLKFYDTEESIFSGDEKTEVSEALEVADEDVWEMADMKDLTKMADEQAEVLIRSMLKEVAKEGEIRVEWR